MPAYSKVNSYSERFATSLIQLNKKLTCATDVVAVSLIILSKECFLLPFVWTHWKVGGGSARTWQVKLTIPPIKPQTAFTFSYFSYFSYAGRGSSAK